MRVLSGIQPSGALHIGNYFGMMKPMIEYMDRSELFVFIVNLHALDLAARFQTAQAEHPSRRRPPFWPSGWTRTGASSGCSPMCRKSRNSPGY